MSKWIDINGPVLANTVYLDGTLVAKDTTFTLPAITYGSAEHKVMGTINAPVPTMIDAMEAAVTKIGLDLGLRKMSTPGAKTLELRWAQDVTKADGTKKTVGCKAFLRASPKGIPGISGEVGGAGENDLTYAVTRYQLFVDGEEYWLVDQLNYILRIGGKDYAKEIANLL